MVHTMRDIVTTSIFACFVLFLFHSGHGDSVVRKCWYTANGTCLEMAKYYCPIGHKLEHRGCGYKETCCYPYVEETPKFRYGQEECGIPSVSVNHKIVGGDVSSILHFPWMASIQKSGQSVCGGSIIGEKWILTAAHCVVKHSSTITVVVGTSKTKLDFGEYRKRYYVDKILKNSKFDKDHPGWGYDLALIKLTRAINLGTTMTRSICLPEAGEDFSDSVCVASGWGHTKEPKDKAYASDGSPYLRHATLPIISKSRCMYYSGTKSKHTICAGYRAGGEDTCQGDSGGPLVCQSKQGIWKQAGIVSVGRGCGRSNEMGIYTEVSAFTQWIQFAMKNY